MKKDDMTPEGRRIRGNDARNLLQNPLLKEAFERVAGYIDGQALACPPDNKDQAQRIVISKQLLGAIRRELTRVVEDGNVAQVQIDAIEQARGLRRFIR